MFVSSNLMPVNCFTIAKDVIGHAHLQMSLLRIKEGRPMSVGDIIANVEQVDEKVGPSFLSILDLNA